MTEISTTKKCPYCAEQIQSEAVVCRYCNHGLINPNIANDITPEGIKLLTNKGKVLSKEVTRRQQAGWVLISSTDEAAQMTMPKKFNWIWFTVWLIVGIFLIEIPLFVYLIMFFVGKPQLVTLTVNDKMQVLINGALPYVPAPQAPSRPQTPEEIEASKKSTQKVLIILGCIAVVVVMLICLAASCNGNGYAPIGLISSLI